MVFGCEAEGSGWAMAKEEGSSAGFRVVDRRPFAADGSRKEDMPAEEKKVETAP